MDRAVPFPRHEDPSKPMPTNRPPDDLLARVLSGEGTPAERAMVDAWAGTDPDAARELEALRRAWGSGAPPEGAWDVDRAWARIAPQLDAGPAVPDIVPVPRRAWPVWTQIAAAAVLIVGAAWGWHVLGPSPGVDVVYAAADGERTSVILADGTTVVLAPRSELVVPSRFGHREREVTLTGEAWFSVVHETERQFTVIAGDFRVRDIGTVFTVRAAPADSIGVSVLEGSVAVRRAASGADAETVLTAGDVGRFTTGGVAALVDRGQPVSSLASWTAGDLALVDVAVDDALAALARWHGTRITLVDPILGRQPVTITLPLDSVEGALADLARLLGVAVERAEGGFVLR
jgi:ferric-dicitrate binding protein FerR (iron transport regulator)